jgi:hypothetical protein
MVNISLTLYTNGFIGSVLKSPTQMGSLGINNSVTNISRLGTFKQRKVLDANISLNRIFRFYIQNTTYLSEMKHYLLAYKISHPYLRTRPRCRYREDDGEESAARACWCAATVAPTWPSPCGGSTGSRWPPTTATSPSRPTASSTPGTGRSRRQESVRRF